MAEVTLGTLDTKIDNLTDLVEKQNGRIYKTEQDNAKQYTRLAVAENDIEALEKRPSAIKIVLLVASVQAGLTMAAIAIMRFT